MALRLREVIGYAVNAAGDPISNGEIKFKLTSKIGFTSTHVIPDEEVTALTDNNGLFSKELWCDEDGLQSINYNAYFPKEDDGLAQDDYLASFSLAYGDGSPINLATAINASLPAPTESDLLYTFIEQSVADEVAAQAGLAIDDPISGAASGSVLFADELGQMDQDNSRFNYNKATGVFKFLDKNYVPFQGSLNSQVLFAIGSNDNVQNNAGLIDVNDHFVNFASDVKITAHGDNKWYIGHLNIFRIGGDFTGSAPIYGGLTQVCNRGNLTGTPNVYGHDFSINLEGPATEAVGVVGGAFRGSAVACPKFVGGRFVGANGYSNADFIHGVEGWARTVSAGATTNLMRAVWGHVTTTGGHTVVEARGLSSDGWVNGGTIENAIGVYIGADTEVGTVSNYAIKSDSYAPSRFEGHVEVAEDLNTFNTWNGKLETPTKNAIDLRENPRRRVVMFNDLGYGSGVDSPITVANNVAGIFNNNFPNPFPYNGVGFLPVNLRTGTTTAACIHTAAMHGTDIQVCRLGQGIARSISRFSIEVLSDVTNTFIMRSGFGDKRFTEPANGVYFRYAFDQNAGKWQGVGRAGGVETVVDLGVTAVAGSMHTYEVRMSADGTIGQFYIDNAYVGMVNSNMPLLDTQPVGAFLQLVKSAGVTAFNAAWLDYLYFEYIFATER